MESSMSRCCGVQLSGFSLILLAGLASGCGSDGADKPTGVDQPRAVATITIVGPASFMSVADTMKLSAVAKDANGRVVPSVDIAWTSSTSLIAAIQDDGTVFPRGVGSVIISAKDRNSPV